MKDTGFGLDAPKRDRLTKVYEATADGLAEYHGNHLFTATSPSGAATFISAKVGIYLDTGSSRSTIPRSIRRKHFQDLLNLRNRM